ncbi:MAG: hypothetical protein ACE5E8_10335 [Acidimicrobiia bacterium]
MRACRDDSNISRALDTLVDGGGEVHISRVERVAQRLMHTVVDAKNNWTDTVVATGVSILAGEEPDSTGITWWQGQPAICFYNAQQQRLEAAFRQGDGSWLRETIVNGDRAGDDCDLGIHQGQLVVAFNQDGQLRLGTREATGWQLSTIDQVTGRQLGAHVSLATGPGDRIAIAHQDETNVALRVTWRIGAGSWQSFEVDAGLTVGHGHDPAAFFQDDGELRVVHGVEPFGLDSESDTGFLESRGSLGGGFTTAVLPPSNTGGYNGAAYGSQGPSVFTRYRLRSALFGKFDSLYLYQDGAGGLDFTTLEQSGSADQRHTYRYLRASHDPFDLPVLTYADFRATWFSLPAENVLCMYRPRDTDSDRLPDAVEPTYGTDPQVADTDGDGRSDGEEVLIDGTDPTVPN